MAIELLGDPSQDQTFPWGRIRWLCNDQIEPGAEMTFGEVTIEAGQANLAHRHPNCEEILTVVSGTCDHSLEGEWIPMGPGDSIRVPRGAAHSARNTGDRPVRMLVCYSSPSRETQSAE